MYPKRRQTIKSRYARRIVRGSRLRPSRRGIDFYSNKPKNEIIYSNKNAVPIDRFIRERGKRVPFSLQNVEWITINNHFLAQGGYGTVYLGKIKFKGKSSSQQVAIKVYKEDKDGTILPVQRVDTLPTVIEKLQSSGVTHPKMYFLHTKNDELLIMEPFVKLKDGVHSTKFKKQGDIIRELDLKNKQDLFLFEQAVRAAANLAKSGLNLTMLNSESGAPRVDAFNFITLKSGVRKLFVQDIDFLNLSDNPSINFFKSSSTLKAVVSYATKYNQEIAEQIIDKVAQEMGFS